MTRNLRIQLADLAEAWLRAARPDLSRERATDLISDWPLAEPWDEETTALVLSRFPAELVPVAGVHFLPQADWSQYAACPTCDVAAGLVCVFSNILNLLGGEPRTTPHDHRPMLPRPSTPLVEVTAQPTAEAKAKWRFGDACGPEHTYRDACQYAGEVQT